MYDRPLFVYTKNSSRKWLKLFLNTGMGGCQIRPRLQLNAVSGKMRQSFKLRSFGGRILEISL